jgi:carbamoyl-phosphate synthase large subunit
VRRKLRQRAGQTDRAESVRHEQLEAIGEEIGRHLGHIGLLDCDAIVNASGCYILDINPRIGGGYPFSHLAGANIPAALVAWMRGEEPEPTWLRATPRARVARYDGFLLLNDRDRPTVAECVSSLPADIAEGEMRLT